MEKIVLLFGLVLATSAAPTQQDEKHLPMLSTLYSKNVFVLTESVLKTDDTEMQKKLAYDVLQSYRDLEHFLGESYNMLRTSKQEGNDEQLLSKKYYELVDVIRQSAVDASARPDGSVRKEQIIHAVEKIASKLRKMTTGVSDDQISRAMITEVSAHSEASMMLLADLYKAVEKERQMRAGGEGVKLAFPAHRRERRQFGGNGWGWGLGYYYRPGGFGFGMGGIWVDEHHHHSHHGHHSYHHHHHGHHSHGHGHHHHSHGHHHHSHGHQHHHHSHGHGHHHHSHHQLGMFFPTMGGFGGFGGMWG